MRQVVMVTAGIMLGFQMLAWFSPNLLGLQGTKTWILRGSLIFIGVVGAAVAIWFFWNKRKRAAASEPAGKPGGGGGSEDIDFLIRDAETKLAAAQIEKGSKIGNLPAVFLIGEPGTAKTSTMVNSGLDPELLAGQVYHDRNLIPTREANIWYAQKALFVEAAGKSVAEPGTWTRITQRLRAGRLGSVVSQGQAHRAAVVMLEADALLRPDAAEALAPTIRALRARLGEISQTIGINLPVYVLLTKTDRVPFFAEYVRNLTNEEVAQVLGVTVPMRTVGSGVYAEEETARLTGLFEQLFRSLCNFRPPILARENEPPRLPGTYEFPREFRKLRPALIQFLVDLCRPSQLTVGPFLRGFYFSGVRPVIVNEVAAPAASQPQRADREVSFDATSMFRSDALRQSAPAAPQVVGTKKVPQWVFLTHLFHNVLLADRMAMGASGSSTKTSMLRRILLASAAALCLFYCIFLAVSYAHNRKLESTVTEAARGIETAESGGLKPPSLDSLKRLESLRQSLALLTGYFREGAPTSYHWGLYVGDQLYPDVRKIYFESFRRVLFGQTQTTLLETLKSLPPTPGPAYSPTYDTLKAYLITTSFHDKSTRPFLSPVLMDRWSANRNVDPERLALAQKQFDFYSDELKIENPFSSDNDGLAVKKAQTYLNQFGGAERVYAAMLSDAAKNTTPINFNRKYPGTVETVVDNYDVRGPFTKPGWDFMRNSLKNPERYFGGELWVLGDQGTATIDRSGLGKTLQDHYFTDFIKEWRAYMKAASVVKFANIQDASKKLTMISSSSSPLLALFSLASQNTAVDAPEVAKAFQSVQAVTPPGGGDRLISAPNQAYMNALLTLQSSVEAAASAPQLNEAVAGPTLTSASSARITTRQVAQAFLPDPVAHLESTVQKLMEDPITSVEALLKRLGPDELNGKGKDLCAQYRHLLGKYPFNPNPAAPQATIADVNGIFHKPEGALWTFYESSLQKLLPKQGADYVPATGAGFSLTPAFVNFFRQSAAFSETIYAGGTADPHITYSLKPLPSEGIQTVRLQIDGQTLTSSNGEGAAKQFVWQGSGAHGAKAFVNYGGGADQNWSDNDGLWAVFRFFGNAETWRASGNNYSLEWINRAGADRRPVTLADGKVVTMRFELDMAGAPPVFQKGYLSKLVCIADVAK